MAVICDELRLIFIAVPHTGGTSIAATLIEHYGGRWLPPDHILDNTGTIIVDQKHTHVRDLVTYQLLSHKQKTYSVLAATRNPFDYVVSEYCYYRDIYQQCFVSGSSDGWWRRVPTLKFVRAAYEQSFEEYVQTAYGWRQSLSVFRRFVAGAPQPTLLRFENLTADFREALQAQGVLHPAPLPHLNHTASKEKPYQAYYSSASHEVIARVFAKDLKQFHYTFDGDGEKNRRIYRSLPALSRGA